MTEADDVRSALMRRIGRSDTEPELTLRRRLWSQGLRYRVDYGTPAGRPDLVFLGPRVAVFIDGCFWHGCPAHYVRPRSRSQFWAKKLQTNIHRDRRQTLQLEADGWIVLRFWEHEVFTRLEEVVEEIRSAVDGNSNEQPPRWIVVEVEPTGSGELEVRREERLRDPSDSRTIHRERTTRKW